MQGDPALAGLADHLSVDITPEGLRIQLLDTQNQPMFAFGSALPNEAARLLLDKIGPVLRRLPEQVSIAGHTDAAPYPGRTMTNWELSIDRANAARRMLLAAGLPEQRLRDVVGHADHDLLLPADPLAAANRRIAIMVLRGTSAPTAPPAQGEKPADEQGPGSQTKGAKYLWNKRPLDMRPLDSRPGDKQLRGQAARGTSRWGTSSRGAGAGGAGARGTGARGTGARGPGTWADPAWRPAPRTDSGANPARKSRNCNASAVVSRTGRRCAGARAAVAVVARGGTGANGTAVWRPDAWGAGIRAVTNSC